MPLFVSTHINIYFALRRFVTAATRQRKYINEKK